MAAQFALARAALALVLPRHAQAALKVTICQDRVAWLAPAVLRVITFPPLAQAPPTLVARLVLPTTIAMERITTLAQLVLQEHLCHRRAQRQRTLFAPAAVQPEVTAMEPTNTHVLRILIVQPTRQRLCLAPMDFTQLLEAPLSPIALQPPLQA